VSSACLSSTSRRVTVRKRISHLVRGSTGKFWLANRSARVSRPSRPLNQPLRIEPGAVRGRLTRGWGGPKAARRGISHPSRWGRSERSLLIRTGFGAENGIGLGSWSWARRSLTAASPRLAPVRLNRPDLRLLPPETLSNSAQSLPIQASGKYPRNRQNFKYESAPEGMRWL